MLELHQTFDLTTSKSKLQTRPGESRKQKKLKCSSLVNSASYWSSGSLIMHQGIFLQALQFYHCKATFHLASNYNIISNGSTRIALT